MNPYQPPRVEVAVMEEVPEVASVLASRGARVGGALVDGLVNLVVTIPYIVSFMGDPTVRGAEIGSSAWWRLGTPVYMLVVAQAAVMALQAVLIVRRGQSVGKIVFRTRIVRVDGQPLGFVRGVLVRTWLFQLVHWAPLPDVLLTGLGLVDLLLIFGRERRCLHDLAAGTRVIQTL